MDAKLNYNDMLKAARPIATKMAQEIGQLANSGEFQPAAYAGLISSLVLQNIITSLAVDLFKPGSAEGAEFIKSSYASVMQDALVRWNEEDLKFWFDNKHGKAQ